MNVLLVEPNASGHRLHYVRLLVQACNRSGASVTVLTSREAVAHENWSLHLGDLGPEMSVRVGDHDFSVAAVAASRDIRATRTVVPDGDSWLATVLRKGWSGNGRLSILVMRADVPSGQFLVRKLRSWAKRLIILGTSFRRSVDVLVLRSPLATRRGPLRWVADPVVLSTSDDGRRAVEDLTAPYGANGWVGVFGRVTTRKNLPLILGALDYVPEGVGLLIGGTIDPEVEEEVAGQLALLEKNGTVVLRMPAPVTDEQLDSAISSVDCVVAAHSNEGPSGIVAKSAAAGRRLVLAGALSLRNDAAALGGQAEWTTLSAEKIGAAISRAISAPAPASSPSLGSDEFTTFLIPELTGSSAFAGNTRRESEA